MPPVTFFPQFMCTKVQQKVLFSKKFDKNLMTPVAIYRNLTLINPTGWKAKPKESL
jgi:hypothetical protein